MPDTFTLVTLALHESRDAIRVVRKHEATGKLTFELYGISESTPGNFKEKVSEVLTINRTPY